MIRALVPTHYTPLCQALGTVCAARRAHVLGPEQDTGPAGTGLAEGAHLGRGDFLKLGMVHAVCGPGAEPGHEGHARGGDGKAGAGSRNQALFKPCNMPEQASIRAMNKAP
jgi:hypothetical protein